MTAYIVATLIGFLIIKTLARKGHIINPLLTLLLAFGIGLGFCGLLTFISFCISQKYNHLTILLLHFIFIVTLILILKPQMNQVMSGVSKMIARIKDGNLFDAFVWLFFATLFIFVHFIASKHTYGEWDAWAIWNMKTKFLLLSTQPFEDIFKNLHYYTHPDYPLLLPSINVWVYTFIGKFYTTTMFNAVLLTMATTILIYAGLKQFIKKSIAFLPCALLLVNPFYLFTSTSQYADIFLAFYLLTTLIMICLCLKHSDPYLTVILGITMGLMAFTKNEGLAMTVVLLILMILRQLFLHDKTKEEKLQFLKYLMGAFILTSLATIYLKLFLSPSNLDIIPNFTLSNLKLINLNRIVSIAGLMTEELVHKKWQLIWLFIMVMILLKLPKFFKQESKWISLFFIIYLCIIYSIYLIDTQVNIAWWMETSLPRIYLYLLPSALFHCFYVFWQDDKPL